VHPKPSLAGEHASGAADLPRGAGMGAFDRKPEQRYRKQPAQQRAPVSGASRPPGRLNHAPRQGAPLPDKGDRMSETDGSPSADKDLTAELEKWKALARKHEERAKETFAELQKLKESQGSSKSDMDRLVQEIKALREENQKAKRDAMLASVAAKTGLSMAKVRRLQGENEAELLADAAEV